VIGEDADNRIKVKSAEDDSSFKYAEELSAIVLEKMKAMAEAEA